MTYETIAEQLIAQGICNSTQSANATEAYYMKWLHGGNIDRSKRQYHVHRSRLLQIGADIAIPYDATRLPPQIRSSEVINLRSAPVPNWYRMPSICELRAA